MEGQSQEHLLHVKRQASLSGSSSADGDVADSLCSSTTDLHCPYCYEEPFALNGLVEHILEGHSYAQRSVKCPICRRPARDMMHHLLQHSQGTSRTASSHSSLPSSSRSAKEWLATRADCDRGSLEWETLSDGSSTPYAMPHPSASPQNMSGSQDFRFVGASASTTLPAQLGSGPSAQTLGAVDLPPEKPRPTVKDSPEMRAKFLEQLLLSAFQLDWR